MANKAGIQTFGKYQILERIATGGMAEIYKAKLEGIGGFQRTFAIKRILPNLSQNSDYIAMLVDEAKVAGLLSHANIVQILDLGQVEGIWYIAMEYVYGPDLGGVLRRASAKGLCLPVPHTVFVAIELLKGLEYAHQRQVMRGGRPVALNIIHRDVSPPNILLSFQGEVKLTDFGIARASLKAMETVSGIIRGRFDYMSPEQASGSKDLDQRSDLFSVGVVLYEMLTGEHPFRADNELQTVERVRTGTYTPVSQRNPEVPFTLETIVDRALRVDRSERYPSATAFKEALDKFFHDAGFIFTHATLASYVKGLFPEAASRPSVVPSGRDTSDGFPTEPGTGPTDNLQPDDPTGRLNRSSMPDLRQRNPTPPPGVRVDGPARMEPIPNFGTDFADEEDDAETVIRKSMPRTWDDPTSTVSQHLEVAVEEHEQETVIRRSPLVEDLDEAPRMLHSPARPRSGRTLTGAGRRRSAVGWVGWLLATAMLFVGLVGGAAATMVVGFFAGFRPIAAVDGADGPVIRVQAPPGTAVRVDGDAVSNEVTVTPGVPHQVEIVVKGSPPWVQELVLEPGERRLIVVDLAAGADGSP